LCSLGYSEADLGITLDPERHRTERVDIFGYCFFMDYVSFWNLPVSRELAVRIKTNVIFLG